MPSTDTVPAEYPPGLRALPHHLVEEQLEQPLSFHRSFFSFGRVE